MAFTLMEIDHIHFYVNDLAARRSWFIQNMGCHSVGRTVDSHTKTEVLKSGRVYFVLSSAVHSDSPVAHYLHQHPSGVADIALKVSSLEQQLAKVDQIQASVEIRSRFEGKLKWAKIGGWGSLSHTLIENTSSVDFCSAFFEPDSYPDSYFDDHRQPGKGTAVVTATGFTHIDHIVLNVPEGALETAVDWYKHLLDLQVAQAFQIETETSGLNSKVLKPKGGEIYFNINEPSCAQSQIQEFLDENRGSGIQHIALKTPSIVQTVRQMRQCGMSFLSVPAAYYTELRKRLKQVQISPFLPQFMQDIETQHILVDWQEYRPNSLLLQIFSHPIFSHRTFFLS
jgi:4-hydroxyphenylpyruvate dioxygenase